MQSWISCWRIILHTWTWVFSHQLTRSSFIGILRSTPHRWLYIFIKLTIKSKNHRHRYYFCWTTLLFQKIQTYKIPSKSHFPTSWPHYCIFCIYHVLWKLWVLYPSFSITWISMCIVLDTNHVFSIITIICLPHSEKKMEKFSKFAYWGQ